MDFVDLVDWKIWIPVLCALISIGGSTIGSFLSARFFAPWTLRRSILYTEKLSRYTKGLSALHAYNKYLDDVFDEASNDFRACADEVQQEKRKAINELSGLLSEQNFVLSTESFCVIRDFFHDCELEWEHHTRCSPSDEIAAYFATQNAVRKALKNLIESGRRDMGWPPQKTISESG